MTRCFAALFGAAVAIACDGGCARDAATLETHPGDGTVALAPAAGAVPPAAAVSPAAAAVDAGRPAPGGAEPPSQAPAQPAPRPGAFADLDPHNDLVVAPPEVMPDCEQALKGAGVSYSLTAFPLTQKQGNVFTCGTEQAVVYRRGPEKFRFNARPHVTCRMALALARFEQIAAAEAETWLGRKIRGVTQGGTYSCRRMQRFRDMVSEHSYANAIDIRSFQLDDGRSIDVLSHFGKLEPPEPEARASKFLRSLARRLYDEDVFSVVLTPYFDTLHRDHFHLDLARYRLDGTR